MNKSRNKTVLLIRPPSSMGLAHGHALQHPIGLCLLASSLRRAGFEPWILDYEVTPLNPARLNKIVQDTNPVVVGITAMTPVITHAFDIAHCIKQAAAPSKNAPTSAP